MSDYLAFPSPATTLQAIMPAIEMLLGRVFAHPALRGRGVRVATLEGEVFRKPPWTRSFPFKEAARGKARAFFALKSVLETVSMPGPLEDMKLTISGFTGESGIPAGLFSSIRRQEQLREMVGQLEARLGRRPPIYRVREMEPCSRVPERRLALVQFDP